MRVIAYIFNCMFTKFHNLIVASFAPKFCLAVSKQQLGSELYIFLNAHQNSGGQEGSLVFIIIGPMWVQRLINLEIPVLVRLLKSSNVQIG